MQMVTGGNEKVLEALSDYFSTQENTWLCEGVKPRAAGSGFPCVAAVQLSHRGPIRESGGALIALICAHKPKPFHQISPAGPD